MSEVTAYHSELAEAMEQVASGYDMSHGITAKSTRKDRVDHFAAVLASDREAAMSDRLAEIKRYWRLEHGEPCECECTKCWLIAEVERLEALLVKAEQAAMISGPLRSTGESDG